MSQSHQQISQTLSRIISEAGLSFTQYNDTAENTRYHLVDGKSIKFWNIFPFSGPRLDKALLLANKYLREHGLALLPHNYIRPDTRESNYSGQTIQVPKLIPSLVVKPLPEYMK